MKTNIRSPIIVTVGHIDHGKTTLLDKIRGTSVFKSEPGAITQHFGASYIPINTVKKICGPLLEKFKIKITIPGLLILDTPGHAAFTTIRRRGGAVSDLAILVIDVTEGFQEQTEESLAILKEFKIPFIVAATKIDRLPGWYKKDNASFVDAIKNQRDDVRDELERRVYNIVTQLVERGYNSDRFDRIENFTKTVAVVPCSGVTGEGVPDLLMMLAGLSQQFLKDRLQVADTGRGAVLEIKEVRGFGLTIDAIIYDGTVRKGDYLVIGGKQPIATKIKALLRPRPLQELRVEKQFESVDSVVAAAGIKIAAPGLDEVIAGSPIIAVQNENDVDAAKAEVQKDVEEVQFTKDVDGITIKADTLGSLEAMIKLLTQENIPIRKAEVGAIIKNDVIYLQNSEDELKRVILAFNIKPQPDAENLAKDLKIKIFHNNVIYRLIEEYKDWCKQKNEREVQEKLAAVIRPAKIKILKGCVFRASKPCVVGVEVLAGTLKPGANLKNAAGKRIGKIKEMQKESKSITEAKPHDRVAISMDEPVVGKHINEGDTLTTALTATDKQTLRQVYDKLTEDEKNLLDEDE